MAEQHTGHVIPLFLSLDILPLPDLKIPQQLSIVHSMDQKYSTNNDDFFPTEFSLIRLEMLIIFSTLRRVRNSISL